MPQSLRRLEEETKEEMQIGVGQIVALILFVLLTIQFLISVSGTFPQVLYFAMCKPSSLLTSST